MLFPSTLAILLATIPRAFTAKAECTNPSVRREWRMFSTDEKAGWISAVKVGLDLPVLAFLPDLETSAESKFPAP